MKEPQTQVTENLLGEYVIVQDKNLYRFTSDSVLLSKFAKPKNGDVVADFCSGCGIVGLHFYALHKDAFRLPSVTLIEMQKPLAELAQKSVDLNGFSCVSVLQSRVQDLSSDFAGKFSLILCNPPYETGGFQGETYEKAICRKELTITLAEIVQKASFCLKFGGRLAMVNRADRLAELCYTFHANGLEIKRVQLVQGKHGAKPYLVLVEGVKGGKPCTDVLPNLINDESTGNSCK